MDDPYTKIPEGTKGTVLVVDDTGTIHVKWDNGSSLGIDRERRAEEREAELNKPVNTPITTKPGKANGVEDEKTGIALT